MSADADTGGMVYTGKPKPGKGWQPAAGERGDAGSSPALGDHPSGSVSVDLDALRTLAEQATPGPWYQPVAPEMAAVYAEGRRVGIASTWGENLYGNAPFIAACSPEVVLALVEAVQAADEYTDLVAAAAGSVETDEGVQAARRSARPVRSRVHRGERMNFLWKLLRLLTFPHREAPR